MEKKVIIEEIGKYEDQPGWLAFDHARKLFFGEHRLGNSVLGTAASVGALTRQQMYDYFRRRYVAPNITVAVAGAFDWDELVPLVRQHCGGWSSGPIGREGIRGGGQRPLPGGETRAIGAGTRPAGGAGTGGQCAAALRGLGAVGGGR